jgi:DNA polymerase III delta prime subunit
MNTSFLNKYKPKQLSDFLLNGEIIKFIETLMATNNLNILLHGSLGVGKTTLIKTLVDGYYKNCAEHGNNIMNINCLKEQGIQYYRTDVKNFCQTKCNTFGCKKIIILDDIDQINEQSQQIFTNYISKYSGNVMFIISCTNLNKINQNIISRLFLIRFNNITSDSVEKLFTHVKTSEKLQIDENVNNKILSLSNLSFRNLLNILEKIKLSGLIVNSKNVYSLCSNINYDHYMDYTKAIIDKRLAEAIEIVTKIYNEGYSVIDIFYFYYVYIKTCEDMISNENKYIIIKYLCKYITIINNNYEDEMELILFTNNVIDNIKS